jgi:anti-sigma factor RsiW
MNQELQWKLQAHLDGELSPGENAEVAALMQKDSTARDLYTELQQTSVALKPNELERRLPESREFFWSKIEREIQKLEAAPAVSESTPWWLTFVRRHAAAVSGFGVATALLVVAAFQMNFVPSHDPLEEIENPLAGSSAFSFRSESQKMTFVWISDSSSSADDEAEIVDESIQ